jgi:hypothetical protein
MTTKQVPLFHCTKPCNSCPYRTDTPVQHWAREEFEGVLEADKDPIGKVYGCHKKNGSICVGFLMDQDKRNFPSIALRISLSKHNVTREYLDKLTSPAPLYRSIREMVGANFPELLRKRKSDRQSMSLLDVLRRIANGEHV